MQEENRKQFWVLLPVDGADFFGICIEFSTKSSCLSVVFIFPYVVVILPSVEIICQSVISSDVLKKTGGLAVQSRDATKFLSHVMK